MRRWSTMWHKKNCWAVWRKWCTANFECLYLLNAHFVTVLEHTGIQITLRLTYWYKHPKKLQFWFHGTFKLLKGDIPGCWAFLASLMKLPCSQDLTVLPSQRVTYEPTTPRLSLHVLLLVLVLHLQSPTSQVEHVSSSVLRAKNSAPWATCAARLRLWAWQCSSNCRGLPMSLPLPEWACAFSSRSGSQWVNLSLLIL